VKSLCLKGFLPSLWIGLLTIVILIPGTIQAGNTGAPPGTSSVTLTWDRPLDRTVRGYRLHYGLTSKRKYTQVLDVGKATSCKLSNLIPGKKYYFVVKAYNAAGKESLPSNEASFTAPKSTPTTNP
jgi:Fibronectin type III domain